VSDAGGGASSVSDVSGGESASSRARSRSRTRCSARSFEVSASITPPGALLRSVSEDWQERRSVDG